MIKKVRIAVDHGNRNMKTCSQVFTTGLTIQDKKPARGEKFLFYEGKYYVLSENRIPYQRDKTQDDRFFILTLFAIVKELEENPLIQPEDVIQVDLPIGLPPKHYAELCERYESYFKRQGKIHDINYCGSTYHITIGEVMAFPQDYAAMMTMIEKLQQIPKVVGIDIGGFTTDYLLMRKGNPDMEACDSMEKGVITMYNKIISGINSEYDILLEESDIDSILQGNTEFYEEAVVRMTESMVQDFVKDLLNSIRERGIDTKVFGLYKAHIQKNQEVIFWNLWEQYLKSFLIPCPFYACKAGLTTCYVTTDGGIYTCAELPEFKIGSVEAGLDVPRIREIIYLEDQEDTMCKKCQYIRHCKTRGCQVANYEIHQNVYQPIKVNCEVTKWMYHLIQTNLTEKQLEKLKQEYERRYLRHGK